MEKLLKKNNILKGSGVLLIVAVMILSTVSVTANTEEISKVVKPYMKSEIKTATQDNNPSITKGEFSDSFESYPDFIVDDFPPWTTYDGDGGQTWTIQDHEFPNQNYVGSFIIFNPSEVVPPLEGHPPHTGDKYAACFDAVTASAPNDDWLITPQLLLEEAGTLSFWGRSLNDAYGLERIAVGISTTDNDPGSFTIISDGEYMEVPIVWTNYVYDLDPWVGENIYIGIHVVSNDAFAFFLDDFSATGVSIPDDTTPPETTCELEGEMDGDEYVDNVTVTLIATDDMSGVAATYYKLDDDSEWNTYSDPFVVSEPGEHIVYFYSVDNADNEEDVKFCTFTIKCPIEIEIQGGIGITVTIRNTGEVDLENVEWSILIEDGIIMPIPGRNFTGTIDNLPAGGEEVIKIFFIGFGKIKITVTAGCAEASSEGFVLLIFVLGVK